jgi:outer membrane protein
MLLRCLAAGILCGLVAPARAADPPQPVEAAASAPADAKKFEGAVGMVLGYSPAFAGSSDYRVKPQLAGFLRYGRFSLSGAGCFTTRRSEDVEAGLDAELLRRASVRLDLSLRVDGGRSASDSGQLAGMGDIRPTVRMRLGARWDFAPRWQFNASSSVDALNRVGGAVVSAGLNYRWPIDARQYVMLSAQVAGATDRYMQAWYGVTTEQSAASGYPVFRAGGGLSSVGIGATWRTEFDPKWAGFAGVTAAGLLGSAADSPLTRERTMWSLSGGLVRRF